MTDPDKQITEDYDFLLDTLLGAPSPQQEERLRQRSESDPAFRKKRENISNLFSTLDLDSTPQPPEGLAERTMAKINAAKQTDALLAQQAIARSFRRPSFSLRELGAVAAVLLILTGVMIPTIRLARQKGFQSQCQANLGQIGAGLQTFAVNHNDHLPNNPTPQAHWLKRKDNTPHASNSAALYRLLSEHHIQPNAFQCPATDDTPFVHKPDQTDFSSPQNISYSYHYALDPEGLSLNDPERTAHAGSFALLADQSPVFNNGQADMAAENSPNHNQRGQAIAFLDGHAKWCKSPNAGHNNDNIYHINGTQTYTGNERPTTPLDTFLLPAHPDE